MIRGSYKFFHIFGRLVKRIIYNYRVKYIQVAAELDSFDGRKDPERCACLVNRLRNCQDKLLNICNKMIEELEPGAIKRSREFRAKYPGNLKFKKPKYCVC